MRKIKIEAHPDAARLERLRVDLWPEREEPASLLPLTCEHGEISYILEGHAIVTPDGGRPIDIRKGNLVTVPAGLACIWHIVEPVRKRYRLE